MSISLKARKLYKVLSNPQVITCKTQYLFILSHMRSRSSVFSHVLGSNPGICGYTELHRAYNSRMDLINMRLELYNNNQTDLKDVYLLDKILHNRLNISEQLLQTIKPKIIFLTREPESTFKSIINMGYSSPKRTRWKEPDRALNYYRDRLTGLEKYAQTIKALGSDYYAIDSDDLVDHTDKILESLSAWLQLPKPLDKHYSKFTQTGKPGSGDPLQNIDSGEIKRTKTHSNISVPADILKEGNDIYQHCRNCLLELQQN